jgi:hypothetical protein
VLRHCGTRSSAKKTTFARCARAAASMLQLKLLALR